MRNNSSKLVFWCKIEIRRSLLFIVEKISSKRKRIHEVFNELFD